MEASGWTVAAPSAEAFSVKQLRAAVFWHVGDRIVWLSDLVVGIRATVSTAAIETVLDGLMAVAALVMMLIYAPTLAAVTLAAVVDFL